MTNAYSEKGDHRFLVVLNNNISLRQVFVVVLPSVLFYKIVKGDDPTIKTIAIVPL
ncbi:MAG: hypothetical protein IT445_09550 [Phycisphaeraceae bacterium]|nr:hypothetical protein [Phycisphaeraceae bacterium]